jgi:hypothetical protein
VTILMGILSQKSKLKSLIWILISLLWVGCWMYDRHRLCTSSWHM